MAEAEKIDLDEVLDSLADAGVAEVSVPRCPEPITPRSSRSSRTGAHGRGGRSGRRPYNSVSLIHLLEVVVVVEILATCNPLETYSATPVRTRHLQQRVAPTYKHASTRRGLTIIAATGLRPFRPPTALPPRFPLHLLVEPSFWLLVSCRRWRWWLTYQRQPARKTHVVCFEMFVGNCTYLLCMWFIPRTKPVGRYLQWYLSFPRDENGYPWETSPVCGVPHAMCWSWSVQAGGDFPSTYLVRLPCVFSLFGQQKATSLRKSVQFIFEDDT